MSNLSEKVKEFLNNKIRNYDKKIKKIKRKILLIKILYASTICISITSSTLIALPFNLVGIPVFVISILGASSAISTALSIKFKFKQNKEKLEINLSKLNKIKSKIEYVINCNGDLSKDEYDKIFIEFSDY